jgi:hypothetical protein
MNQIELSRLSSDSDEQLRGRLQNVFRILAEPEHSLREQAVQVRQNVSSTWEIRAAQNKWFPWPTTIAVPGTRPLKGLAWREHGMLDFLGYHVGKTHPTSQDMRRCILDYAFEYHLPPLNDPNYFLEWGKPRTPQRLNKLANTLAALTRNAKRRDEASYAVAIDDWEDDLDLLHNRYYVGLFQFGWPTTYTLN